MKLTSLLRLGLLGSTTFSLVAALSSCTSGDDSFSPNDGAGAASNGQAGSLGGPLGSSGQNPNGFGGSQNANAGNNSSSNAGNGNAQGGQSNQGGNLGDGGSAVGEPCTNLPPNNGDTCQHAVEYGWCSQDWIGDSCKESCGKCSSGSAGTGSGGSNGNGGSGNNSAGSSYGGGGGQPPKLEGGTNGWATRYWDCCKPHCAWKGNVPGGNAIESCNKQDQSIGVSDAGNACTSGDGAYMCHDFGPWAVSDTLAYGFAAVKNSGDSCGKCYQLQFSGSSHTAQNDPGAQSLNGKTMIVQAINVGNDLDQNQFDLLIPGGGVGAYNACSSQWGTSDLGEQYGGFYLACQKKNGYQYAASKTCAANMCASVFKDKPELLAGCNFFVNWFAAPDNPNLVYKEITCPAAITAQSGLKR